MCPERFSREMPLGEVLTEKQVIGDMASTTKKGAIEDLVGILWKEKLIANQAGAVERVLEREEFVSTALGEGVAIPHARLDVGLKPVIAVGRHLNGLDFGAPDGAPVNLILLVLWQPERAGLMNRLFAGLVSKLADTEFRKNLLSARDEKEIAGHLADVRIDMQAGRATKCEADMLVALQLLETKRRAGKKGLSRRIELARDELPGSMLSRFDRLLDRYGEALVEAPDGICRGCNVQLSSSFASEMLKNPDNIYICERCGKYLVHHF